MKIYFAGIPGGRRTLKENEESLFEIGLTHRLLSFYYQNHMKILLGVAEEAERKSDEDLLCR